MKYQVGETIRLLASITDVSGDPADPTTVKISINKPDGSVAQASVDMTNPEAGSYHYDYTIADITGMYSYSVTATTGTRITIVKSTFDVDDSI